MKTPTMLAYFAGLIDGEGYIGVKRRMPSKANHMACPKYSVVLFIAMTDRAPIDFLAEHMGHPDRVRSRKRKEHYKTIYEFELENDRAVEVLRAIQPYTVCRKEHIRLALDLHNLRKSARQHRTKVVGTRIWAGGRAKGSAYKVMGLSDEFIAKCDVIYRKLLRMSPRSGQEGRW